MALTQPIGRFSGGGLWELVEQWECPLSDGSLLVVMPGFQSDGASIPRFLWPAVGPRFNPRTFAAAFCHDALYASKLRSRAFADNEFRRHLSMLSFRLERCYWLAVRVFGRSAWRRHKEHSVERAKMYVSIRRCNALLRKDSHGAG